MRIERTMSDHDIYKLCKRKGVRVYRAAKGWFTMTHPKLQMIQDDSLIKILYNMPDTRWTRLWEFVSKWVYDCGGDSV